MNLFKVLITMVSLVVGISSASFSHANYLTITYDNFLASFNDTVSLSQSSGWISLISKQEWEYVSNFYRINNTLFINRKSYGMRFKFNASSEKLVSATLYVDSGLMDQAEEFIEFIILLALGFKDRHHDDLNVIKRQFGIFTGNPGRSNPLDLRFPGEKEVRFVNNISFSLFIIEGRLLEFIIKTG